MDASSHQLYPFKPSDGMPGADVSRVGIFSEICIRLIMSVTLSLMSSCGRAVGTTTGVRGVNKVDWQRRENTSELALSKRGKGIRNANLVQFDE